MKQLGGMDASFLYMETPQTPMHVGGLYLFEPAAGRDGGDFYDDFKAHMARRLHLAPILAKVLSPMPLDMDHPVWIDATQVDLDYHIRRLGLPRPGTRRQLEELVGRLHSNFLDRSRPLWEFYVIDGLDSGHPVLYTKVHHAAIDGAAGMQITKAMYDTTPTPREVEPPPPKPAGSAPGGNGSASQRPDLLSLLGAAHANFLRQQVRTLQMIPEAWKAVAKAVLPDTDTLSWQPLKAPTQLIAPKTPLNGTITSQRSYAARSVPLDAAKRVAKQTGAKLNDVVLAACSAALRRWLQERSALPAESLIAAVPVSLREAGNTESNNQSSVMLVSLASHLADPLQRLAAIVESSQQAKQITGTVKDVMPRDFSILGAPLVLQGLIGLYGRSGLADRAPPPANVTVSNVPGPAGPLYAAGAKMLTMYPVSIPTHGVALNITVQSYNGALDFGLTTCRRLLPEVGTIADYILDELDELKRAALGDEAAAASSSAAGAAVRAAPKQAAATAGTASPASARRAARKKALPSVAPVPAAAAKAPSKRTASARRRSAGAAAPVAAPAAKKSAPRASRART